MSATVWAAQLLLLPLLLQLCRAAPAPGPACSQPEVRGLPFCDVTLSVEARAADLVGRLALEEIGPQLTARSSPAIPRLGIPAFYWGTNTVHGINNAVTGGVLCLNATGRCVTIWPAGPNFGATFNASLFRQLGQTTGVEMRALNNVQWGPAARPDGLDGLVAWGPTINLVRDPRWGRIQETPSEDPFLNGVFAREVTRGLQEGEDPRYLLTAATLKHVRLGGGGGGGKEADCLPAHVRATVTPGPGRRCRCVIGSLPCTAWRTTTRRPGRTSRARTSTTWRRPLTWPTATSRTLRWLCAPSRPAAAVRPA